METAPSDTNNGLLFANFNQDFGCFVSVTGRGFRIFNADPLREKEARHFPPGKQEDGISKQDISSPGGAAEMTVTADATLEAVGKGLAKIVKVGSISDNYPWNPSLNTQNPIHRLLVYIDYVILFSRIKGGDVISLQLCGVGYCTNDSSNGGKIPRK